MLALAAIIAVGLLNNATVERSTAKSVDDRYQARLAAENALEAAKKALVASPTAASPVIKDDSFILLRADGTQANATGAKDAYYFIAKARADGATVDCYPLFSGGSTSQLSISHTAYPPVTPPTAPAPFPNPAVDSAGKSYPHLYTFQQPAFTQWQELRDPNDTASAPNHNLPYQRYTYWIEDLSGYIDASVAGNIDDTSTKPSGVHKRSGGIDPKEIALFTIFEPPLASDSGATLAQKLITNRPILYTVPTLQQVAPPPSGNTDATQPNLVVKLGIDIGGEQNLIPFGFAFKDQGKGKTNINSLVNDATKSSDEKVSSIASTIATNLPSFASLRKGGLPASDDYLKTVSANIIDYVDNNSDATVGDDYRGLDLYPLVVEFYERFIWQHNGGETTNFYQKGSTWWADVKATGYIQLWNMTNKEIKSGTLTFSDINRYYAYVGGTSEGKKFEDSFGKGTITFSATNSLKPNEFKAFQVYEHVYNFDTGLTIRPTGNAATVYLGSEDGPKIDPSTSGYMSEWNGRRVERAGGGTLDGARRDGSDKYLKLNYSGLERSYANLTTPGSKADPTWRGTLPGLRYDSTSESTYNVGDPRGAFYIAKIQAAASYAKGSSASDPDGNSAWWGRMYQKYLIEDSGKWYSAETLVTNWPDGDHTTTHGLLPKDTTVDPISITTGLPVTESSKAPVSLNKSGSLSSITELGNVYDPIQWKPAGFNSKPGSASAVATTWRDAWKNDLIADGNYGDASTLRIGSPEFKQFDKDDSRAARLMDLLGIGDRVDTRGLINVNTASREVLRSLGAGIQIQRDNAISPSSVFGPTNSSGNTIQADKFADTVISNRPFLSTSQLSGILTNPTDNTTKFFGNPIQWSANSPTEWNDSAREEYFSRLFGLTSVRSRNFRVFVTGQSLDKTGRVLSTVNRVYQVFLKPTRDATGAITGQSTEITYDQDI